MPTHPPTTGTVYEYTPRLQLFELTPTSTAPKNAVLFIAGLTDGLLTVPYLNALNAGLPEGWSLFQIIMTSSYTGWATGSLTRDCAEIRAAVQFLKGLGKEKVVLFGHSTGCQDSINYVLKEQHGWGIDGFVLQAPVSDRGAMGMMFEKHGESLEEYNQEAREWAEKYGEQAVLPPKFSKMFFDAHMSAYRWLSLAEKGGDDDYFSEDLEDEVLQETFGRIDKPLLVLFSGEDEFVPPKFDKWAVVKRWQGFVKGEYWSKFSTVVAGASHAINAESTDNAEQVAVEAAKNFLCEF